MKDLYQVALHRVPCPDCQHLPGFPWGDHARECAHVPDRAALQKAAEAWGVRLVEPVDEELGVWAAELPEPLARELEAEGYVQLNGKHGWVLAAELP